MRGEWVGLSLLWDFPWDFLFRLGSVDTLIVYGMLSTVPRPASIELPCHHWAALGLAGVFSVEPQSCIASYLYSSSICQYTVYLPSILFAVGESFLVFNHSTHFWLLFQMVYSLSISQPFFEYTVYQSHRTL